MGFRALPPQTPQSRSTARTTETFEIYTATCTLVSIISSLESRVFCPPEMLRKKRRRAPCRACARGRARRASTAGAPRRRANAHEPAGDRSR
eukprot:6195859-Pleurochrysis_carterae.AAC.1